MTQITSHMHTSRVTSRGRVLRSRSRPPHLATMSDNDSIIASTDSQVAAPTTPEACVDSNLYNPDCSCNPHNIPFTSGHLERDETLIALGNEMVGHVVGPMPTQNFLDFLPCNPAKAPSFMKRSFAKLAKQRTEPAMYDVFVCVSLLFFFLNGPY